VPYPSSSPPLPEPSAPPSESPTPQVEWALTVVVRSDEPDARPAGELLIAVDAIAPVGATWLPIFETVARFSTDGEIRVVVEQSDHPPPYAVTVFGADEIDGFELCPGGSAEARVEPGAFDAGHAAELVFRLCRSDSEAASGLAPGSAAVPAASDLETPPGSAAVWVATDRETAPGSAAVPAAPHVEAATDEPRVVPLADPGSGVGR
jgi:hypothetical protein